MIGGGVESVMQQEQHAPTSRATQQCCELCIGKMKSTSTTTHSQLQDLNELMGDIQRELKCMRRLLKMDLDERQSKMIRKMLLETQSIRDAFLVQAKHWCRHCVGSHLNNEMVRFAEI